MIAGEHFDEEFLIFLAEGSPLKDTHPHLIDCADCRSAVDEYRTVLTSFAEESTWDRHPLDETPNPQTIATLRAFVDRTHREDAEAEPLVAELLSGPREEWMPRLMADSKYRTAGVVRRLIAAMPAAVRATPRDAEAMATVATSIAEMLPESNAQAGRLLRAASWRERAFAAFYVGEHQKASAAIDTSLHVLDGCTVGEHEEARSRIVLALLYRETDDLQAGLNEIDRSSAYFESSGQESRLISALITKTALLSKAGDFRNCVAIAEELLFKYQETLSDEQRATLYTNLGYFHRELGDFVRALENFDIAAFLLDALDMKGEAIRSRWNLALTLARAGDLNEALKRLTTVAAEFESFGMSGAAVLVGLDAAEIHIARFEYAAVEMICERAIEQFRRTGLGNSSRAMMALALLREASKRQDVPPRLLRRVVASVRHLPQQLQVESTSISEPS